MMLEAALNLAGLLLTGLGAWWAARNVIISREQAELLSGTYFNFNAALRDALMAQSRGARNGLLSVVLGTGLQVAALMLPVFVPGQGHEQVTRSMALGSCTMEDYKSGAKGEGFITACMLSKGFAFDHFDKKCAEGAIVNYFIEACYRAVKGPGLIERIRGTLGLASGAT